MTSNIFFALDLRTLLPIPAVSDHRRSVAYGVPTEGVVVRCRDQWPVRRRVLSQSRETQPRPQWHESLASKRASRYLRRSASSRARYPHTRQLPVVQAPPACHPRSAPEFRREHLLGNAAAKDEDDAGQARAIRDARPSAFWSMGWSRQERLDEIPQGIWKQRSGHTPFTLPRRRGSGFGCFVTRSKENPNIVFFVIFVAIRLRDLCGLRSQRRVEGHASHVLADRQRMLQRREGAL